MNHTEWTYSWRIGPNADEEAYQLALMAITNVLDEHDWIVGNSRGDPNTSPHTENCICFNGLVPSNHDSFYLPNSVAEAQSVYSGHDYDQCCTLGHPYDEVVRCCLLILKSYLGKNFNIIYQGRPELWDKAQQTLNHMGIHLPEKRYEN